MGKIIEGVVSIIKGLNPRQRRMLLRELIRSKMLTEDEYDLMLIDSRRNKPTKPFDLIVKELKARKRI